MTIVNGAIADANDVLNGLLLTGQAAHIQNGAFSALPASPVAGDMFIATDIGLTFVCYVSGTWRGRGTVWTNQSAVNFQNSSAETTLMSSPGIGTLTLPAGFLTVGRVLRVRAAGLFSTTGTPTGRMRFRVGSVQPYSSDNQTLPGTVTLMPWNLDIVTTCVSVGVTGTLTTGGFLQIASTAIASVLWTQDATETVIVDTTISNTMDLTWTFNAASSSNKFHCHSVVVTVEG